MMGGMVRMHMTVGHSDGAIFVCDKDASEARNLLPQPRDCGRKLIVVCLKEFDLLL
jgi:hypothetical protein